MADVAAAPPPVDVAFIRETFHLSRGDLAKALGGLPTKNVGKWESQATEPVRLNRDVLAALYLVAFEMDGKSEKEKASVANKIRLGVGNLVYRALI